MKIKIDQTKVPNKFHLSVQQNNRSLVQKNKKKYDRKKLKKSEY